MKGFSDQSDQDRGRVPKGLRYRLWRPEALVFVLIFIVSALVVYSQISRMVPTARQRNIVGLIRIEGYIETPLTVSLYTDIVNQAMFNTSVKAVVLVVDSGGGYADYVEEIYLDLLEVKTRKPLVASIITALSGGYYIAVAADYIYALPTSFIGSVGVIGSGPDVFIPSESVFETGAYKATGFSRLLFAYNLSHALDSFVSAVETNRNESLKLSSNELRRAMIYLGSEAVDAGLVDEIGSLQKAIAKAAADANLEQYEIVELMPLANVSYVPLQGSYNQSSTESKHLTLKILDELHPPPAVHYIYLPSQVLIQRSYSSLTPEALATGLGDVVVDLSHGNQISWWDLDILIAELAKRNVTVSFVSQRLELDTKLANASSLMVASPTEVYTDEERNTIEKFVEKGGLLLMFFDPAWEYIGPQGLSQGIIAPINSISTKFGFSFGKGYLYNEEENYGLYRNIYVRNFASNQLTEDLESIVLFTATHIYSMEKELAWTSNNTYSSTAERTGSYTTIALTERGAGTIIAFGDITFLSEPYCYVEDNYQLILNLASFLTESKS